MACKYKYQLMITWIWGDFLDLLSWWTLKSKESKIKDDICLNILRKILSWESPNRRFWIIKSMNENLKIYHVGVEDYWGDETSGTSMPLEDLELSTKLEINENTP